MNIWEQLPPNFTVLAPMEGVTDVVFRQVIAQAGRPDLFFTEFTNVSSYASERGRNNALERLRTAATDAPIIAQIWGKIPEHFAQTAEVLEELGFAGLDINMGCPDRHVIAAGGGSDMIRHPELAIKCINEAKNHTKLPVSVKTRLGYAYIDEFREWLPILLQQNLVALAVHLRTRKEMSKVAAHFELIPEIVALRNEIAPQTKLIINGDIKDLAQIRELSQQYAGVDGWMIGRGVFENPYCFTEHIATRAELLNLLRLHLDLFDRENAEILKLRQQAVLENKQHEVRGLSFEPLKHYFKIYVRDFPGANELRTSLMTAKNTLEAREILVKVA